MALASKTHAQSHAQPAPGRRRIWKAPRSRAKWLFLVISLLFYGGIYAWYSYALKTQDFVGPSSDPLRLFGIAAFGLVLLVAAYSLRRRFVRVLPGPVQDWLWLHTWLGIAAILIAFLHENYQGILHDFAFNPGRFIEAGFGMSALYALLALVISGIVGRLLDWREARVIAVEASRNGAGIAQAVEDRLHEQQLMLERLAAGKSLAFKTYCTAALGGKNPPVPAIAPHEQADLQRAQEVLASHASLLRSLRRQQRAQCIIRLWRYIHIPLSCLALAVIGLHSLIELAKMALQLAGIGQ
ncbi:MAG: hypothetical protein IMW89_09955 [Ktedonobacteraceae bacterium]|nr:hypothetical protein [Ktedonobacteraceae bacterium]